MQCATVCQLRQLLARVVLTALVLLLAGLVKLHYGPADAIQLAWLLKPTAALVGWLSGLEFVDQAGEGYFNARQNLLIAPACSGINFLVIATAMGSLLGLFRLPTLRLQLAWLLLVAVLSFGLTLVVNSGRILVAMALYQADLTAMPLSQAQLHRIEGIVVYYLFLCFFSWLLSFILNKRNRSRHDGIGQQASGPGTLQALWPLVCYLAFSLGIPLLNQAWQQQPGLFVEHSLTVAAVSIALALILGWAQRWRSTQRPMKPHCPPSAYETDHTHCRG